MSPGDRQSYGSSPICLKWPRTPSIAVGSTPPSIADETKAAKPGSVQPCSLNRSGWMNESPLNGWSLSTGPRIWTPHAVQACLWITALESTTLSLSPFLTTVTLSVGATATIEKAAPAGFQHFVQPQAWLCAIPPSILTSTGRSVQAQTRTPPANEDEPFFTPLSRSGWIACECAMVSSRAGLLAGLDQPALRHPIRT